MCCFGRLRSDLKLDLLFELWGGCAFLVIRTTYSVLGVSKSRSRLPTNDEAVPNTIRNNSFPTSNPFLSIDIALQTIDSCNFQCYTHCPHCVEWVSAYDLGRVPPYAASCSWTEDTGENPSYIPPLAKTRFEVSPIQASPFRAIVLSHSLRADLISKGSQVFPHNHPGSLCNLKACLPLASLAGCFSLAHRLRGACI